MASSPPPAFVTTFLLLLVLLAGDAAAQGGGSVPPSQQPDTNASDVAALRVLFQRWGLDGGAAAEDPCRKRVWFESFEKNASVGCSCSSNECRVTHLNVTGYWNITEVPPALFNLTELVSLDLSNNNLSGSIPQEVASLSKLETWWMFDNYIDEPIPEFIQNLTNLKDLRIYGMKLQGPIPTNFSKLVNLEYLMLGDLDGNHSSFDFIASWANLSTLSLWKCRLTGQLPSAAPNLPKLKYLDLRSNNLSGPIRELLPYMNSDYIYVGENNFNGHLPSEIVQKSVALDVSNNPLVNGSLPNNPAGMKWPINYIGTSVDASTTIDSENLAILNCLHRKECKRNNLTNVTTRAMCLVSLLKLSSRFPPTSERIKEIGAQNKGNTVLELQQRSIEFSSIIQRHQSMKSSLLERMPVLDEASYLVKRAASTQATISSVKPSAVAHGDPLKLPNGVAKPPPAPLADLLDLSSDDAPVTTSAPAAAPNDFLQDLLGLGWLIHLLQIF